MKIVKRDGKIVDYNSEKIRVAINKANAEVGVECTATSEEIEKIILYIEGLKKKRMLVEDIQDIIEEKLMEFGKFALAKEYIVYRYTRTLVRKSNTTDATILSMIKNNDIDIESNVYNKKIYVAHEQRNLIAGEVSKDLTSRILLPEKISNAHNEGSIYFHDAEYFIQPIINSCIINISDMLDNGTVINGIRLNSPKDFLSACIMLIDIILSVSSSQCGAISIEVKHLAKYLKNNEKQLELGIKTILYGINTLVTTNGICPNVTLIINLEEKDSNIEENARMCENILKQCLDGAVDEHGNSKYLVNPKIAYVLYDNNSLNGGKYDNITRLTLKYLAHGGNVKYISQNQMIKNSICSLSGENELLPVKEIGGKYINEGRFNQGKVSVNLAQAALRANGNEDTFWNLLDENIETAFEALMIRHYALLGTLSNVSPIHWQYGAIARRGHDTKIDQLLKSDYSTLTLCYAGINEAIVALKGEKLETEDKMNFAKKIVKRLYDACEYKKKVTDLGFTLMNTTEHSINCYFTKIDKEKFGYVKNITDKESYDYFFEVNEKDKEQIINKLQSINDIQEFSNGGGLAKIYIQDILEDKKLLEDIIKYSYDNMQYIELINKNN